MKEILQKCVRIDWPNITLHIAIKSPKQLIQFRIHPTQSTGSQYFFKNNSIFLKFCQYRLANLYFSEHCVIFQCKRNPSSSYLTSIDPLYLHVQPSAWICYACFHVFIDQFSGLFRSIESVLYRTVYTYVWTNELYVNSRSVVRASPYCAFALLLYIYISTYEVEMY